MPKHIRQVRLSKAKLFTNKDLKDEIERGTFREDLYYRLNVIHIHLAPLRERRDDIPPLVTHFIGKSGKNLGKQLDLSVEALRLLISLPWEGNVRELENTIERAAILCEDNTIRPEDVQPDGGCRRGNRQWSETLDLGQFIPKDLLSGRSICVISPFTMTLEFIPILVRNIFICSLVVF